MFFYLYLLLIVPNTKLKSLLYTACYILCYYTTFAVGFHYTKIKNVNLHCCNIMLFISLLHDIIFGFFKHLLLGFIQLLSGFRCIKESHVQMCTHLQLQLSQIAQNKGIIAY